MNVIILPLSQFPKNQYDPYGGLPGTVMQWVETPELGAIVHIANEFVFIPLKRLREYSPKLFEALNHNHSEEIHDRALLDSLERY